jgi:FkbM family methyltransferase
VSATPRNAPCPCGSGKRYKECHGALADAPSGTLERLAGARAALERNDLAQARATCEEVLRESPEHPQALELLAQADAASGSFSTALRTLLAAVRALPRYNLPATAAYGVWTTLNATFTAALSRHDAASRVVRDRYIAWQAARSAMQWPRDVAVVLVLGPSTTAESASQALQSIVAQTRPPAQLVVSVVEQSPAARFVRARLDLLTIDARFLEGHAATAAEAWNRGVQAASSAWVLILEPPACLAPSHLATVVDVAGSKGARFAWSGATFDRSGGAPEAALAAESSRLDVAQTSAVKADSLGLALIGQWSPLAGAGALVFERRLHADLGGFRPLRGHEAWDFCLRACWEGEPVRSEAATYRHAIARADDMTATERESIQLAMFREFHGRASREDASANNPFAPSLAIWGTRYIRRLFEVGHVLMVDVDALARFVVRIEAMEREALPDLTPGINLLGFAFGEFGLGESMRSLARACAAGGIPFVVKDVEQHLSTRQTDASIAAHLADDLKHSVSLMCVNPDLLPQVRSLLLRTRAHGGIAIGYWYWELETTPRTWEPAYGVVDEVWCATQFVADAIRRATQKPVVKIPPPLEVVAPPPYRRGHFGLPDDRFLFLFTFDYNSFVKRKNPEAVIDAFREAFPRSRDDVGLVVKSVNGANHPQRVAALMAHAGGDPRIFAIDRFLTREESYGLTVATDAYVSLHRAEGLGLGLCEAMALGRPTIATAYSGNLEFMNETNSLLVDYRLVPVARGDYLVDDERFVWAEPDVASAARCMRHLADDAALRARLAAEGQREITTRFTRERTAALIRDRLETLGVTKAGTPRQRAGEPVRAEDDAFVSHAQNGEDALLAHVLAGVTAGRYVDVGAHDPDVHSVTRAFYDRGWSGVNVEPATEWHERLREARPRDVNLHLAAGRRDGTATLHAFAGTGLSTIDARVAQGHADAGRTASTSEVPMQTLARIFDEHAGGEVHFLKIDVEGAEADVLAGADFERHRPWIVVVESTRPLTGIASHGDWEATLLSHRYRFAFDDGLNRYYVGDEHAALRERFEEPPRWRVRRAADVAASAPGLSPEQRLSAQDIAFLDLGKPSPTLARPASQLCTRSQFDEPPYRWACRLLREPPTMRRRQWEYAYVLRCLEVAAMLQAGRRGLGFGCAGDPLVAVLAAQGCEVVATDPDLDRIAGDRLNPRRVCAADDFGTRVDVRGVDMRSIPDDLRDFDFAWSCGGPERMASCAAALDFYAQSLRCLRPGGLAVHTTAFNLSSNGPTLESPELCALRRQDVERLVDDLSRDGHRVWPLNLNPGDTPVDRFVDTPPYRGEPHLRVRHGRFVVTSLGIATVAESTAGDGSSAK